MKAAINPLLIIFLIFAFVGQAKSQTQFMGWTATLLLRPGINFYLSSSLTATAGYAFIPQQRISAGVTLPGVVPPTIIFCK